MPLYEVICTNQSCPHCGQLVEAFYPSMVDSWEVPCQECGALAKRMPSRFGTVWLGSPNDQRYKIHKGRPEYWNDYHIAYRVRSSKSGKPEPVVITSWEEQKRFCKEEGLYNPRELPPEKGEV